MPAARSLVPFQLRWTIVFREEWQRIPGLLRVAVCLTSALQAFIHPSQEKLVNVVPNITKVVIPSLLKEAFYFAFRALFCSFASSSSYVCESFLLSYCNQLKISSQTFPYAFPALVISFYVISFHIMLSYFLARTGILFPEQVTGCSICAHLWE